MWTLGLKELTARRINAQVAFIQLPLWPGVSFRKFWAKEINVK